MSYIGTNPEINGVDYIPVADLVALNAILNPKEGMTRYVTSETSLYVYDGATWLQVGSGGGGTPTPNAEPIHYGLFSGSAAGAVAVLGQSQAGTFTVTRIGTGLFDIDYTSLGLTETPCVVVCAHANGGTTDELTSYIQTESTTVARVRIAANNALIDLDFTVVLCPMGADAPAQASQIVYAFKGDSSTNIVSENISGGWVDTFVSAGSARRITYAGLSLTNPAMCFGSFVDNAGSLDDHQMVMQEYLTDRQTFQINQFNVGGVFQNSPVNIIMFLEDANDGSTTLANSKWFAGRALNSASAIEHENISGAYTSVSYNGVNGQYTWTYGETLTETPSVLHMGANAIFDTGDGGTRFWGSVANNSLTTTINANSNGTTLSTPNGFTSSQVLMLPNGSDSRY